MIVFSLLPDGGFICGDTESRITSYAYPTSDYADDARKYPNSVASVMLDNEKTGLRILGAVAGYDKRNWLILADAFSSSIDATALREIANMVEG